MTALYIFLAFEAAILIAWITYAMNTELELYCWINKKRVFCGYFDTLSDLNKHVYKLEALHGENLTDWIINPVRKKKFVKQISGIEKTILKLAIRRNEKMEDLRQVMKSYKNISSTMNQSINNIKQTIQRTNDILNEN